MSVRVQEIVKAMNFVGTLSITLFLNILLYIPAKRVEDLSMYFYNSFARENSFYKLDFDQILEKHDELECN